MELAIAIIIVLVLAIMLIGAILNAFGSIT